MEDMDKTKKQLLEEIADLRRKIKDFENATSNRPEKIHEMKQSEELYRLLVEHANEVIMVIQNEKIRYVNNKATEITGYSKKELSSRSFFDFIHPADRKLISIDEIYNRHGQTAPQHLTCRIVDRKAKTIVRSSSRDMKKCLRENRSRKRLNTKSSQLRKVRLLRRRYQTVQN